MSKKFKSPEDWKKIIGRLDDKNFEHLCYQLIKPMEGFVNPDLRNGSYDGGRDIDIEYRGRDPAGVTEITEKWRFECKKYSKGVSFDDISGKIKKADLNKIDKLVIMSNMHLTPDCKDEIKKIQDNLYCKIINWTGVRFQDILFNKQNICEWFFPDEKIPKKDLDAKRPQELINIMQRAGSNFGEKLEIKLKKGQKPPTNIEEAADIIKENLLNLKDIDLNIKSLIYQQMAGLFLNANRKDDALLFINESLKITPNNISALLNKGGILDELCELDDASECYDEILEIDKHNKFALNDKAYNLRKRGNIKEALDLVNKALDIDPDFTVAICNKTSILSDFGKTEEALDFLEIKLKKHQNSKALLDSKVVLLIDLLDLKEAMRLNEQILEIDPENIDAIHAKGLIYANNSDYQKKEKYLKLAIEQFEKSIIMDENNPVFWSNKIHYFIEKDSLVDAENLVDSIIERFPKDSDLLEEKGLILLKKGNPKEALKFFNKSLDYNFSILTLIYKANAQLDLRKNKEAKETAEWILNHDPKDSYAWLIKGDALKRLHQIALARRCFKKAEEYEKVPRSLLE
ncbi:MAG: hypothetical protein A7315_14405 [Candidatus Altiarchaeales archaeon WOR_SM1_79]|nr:MAG: hypothetical protein A7315_14405 [Candidatus Altiarchaeales archaeon WOR_SM1_79]